MVSKQITGIDASIAISTAKLKQASGIITVTGLSALRLSLPENIISRKRGLVTTSTASITSMNRSPETGFSCSSPSGIVSNLKLG
ncbi:hypothetical protein HanRHA438_Chr08g0345101 [Helianthus annuus]|nr:hypothetical protein HanRHA438_Chr08g0345101 [Helianthus annuus]